MTPPRPPSMSSLLSVSGTINSPAFASTPVRTSSTFPFSVSELSPTESNRSWSSKFANDSTLLAPRRSKFPSAAASPPRRFAHSNRTTFPSTSTQSENVSSEAPLRLPRTSLATTKETSSSPLQRWDANTDPTLACNESDSEHRIPSRRRPHKKKGAQSGPRKKKFQRVIGTEKEV